MIRVANHIKCLVCALLLSTFLLMVGVDSPRATPDGNREQTAYVQTLDNNENVVQNHDHADQKSQKYAVFRKLSTHPLPVTSHIRALKKLRELGKWDRVDFARRQLITTIFMDIDPTGKLIDEVINEVDKMQPKHIFTMQRYILQAIFQVYMNNNRVEYIAGYMQEDQHNDIIIVLQIVTFATKIDQLVPSVHQCLFERDDCVDNGFDTRLAYLKLKLLGIIGTPDLFVARVLSEYPSKTEIAEFEGMWASEEHFNSMLTILRNRILDRVSHERSNHIALKYGTQMTQHIAID